MDAESGITEFPYPGDLAVCAGGKPVKECDVAPDMEKSLKLFPSNRHYSETQTGDPEKDFIYPSYQAFFPLGCVACRHICEAVYEVKNGQRAEGRPAIFSMDIKTYGRVRAAAFENLTRLLKASAKEEKKDKVTVRETSEQGS